MLGGGAGGSFDKSQLIDPAKALPGRAQKMPNIDSLKHYVLGNKIDHVPEGHKVAVFANGVSVFCLFGSCAEYVVMAFAWLTQKFPFFPSLVLLGIRKGYLEIAKGYLFYRRGILCWIYTQPNL
jgi:hypothetical protein